MPDEWLDYEIDEEMRLKVLHEICQPVDENGDDVANVINEIRGEGGFGATDVCAPAPPLVIPTEEDEEEECLAETVLVDGMEIPLNGRNIVVGDVLCRGSSIVVGDVSCPLPDGECLPPLRVTAPEVIAGPEPPDDPGVGGKGPSKARRRLRVHAKFTARMVMVLRARHGRLACEPANQLLVSKDYSRILRKPEYNMRSIDIEAHRRDVLNMFFSDLPFEQAPLVRSRLPTWFKDLMGVPEPATRPLMC